MKHLIIFISIISTITCFSQNPNPELFQTWYLNFVQVSDLDIPYNVSEIEPQISPTLIISEDLNFSGEGACNTFEGTFSNATSDYLETILFSHNTNDCNVEIHNSFESSYFSFMQSAGSYQIILESEGLKLIINNPIFGSAIFTNFTMSTTDFDFNHLTIYPNPVNSQFTLNSHNLMISKIQIINSVGQTIKTVLDNFEKIDVSDLAFGIYVLKINTESGFIYKRIIKTN